MRYGLCFLVVALSPVCSTVLSAEDRSHASADPVLDTGELNGVAVAHEIDSPGLRTATPSYTMHGIARPSQEAQLSAPLNGVLRKILVEEGDVVEAEQALAVIDDHVARMVVQVAEAAANQAAQIKLAEDALSLAQFRLERLNTLKQTDAVTTYEIEEATKDVRRAEAQLSVAKQELVQAQRQLDLERARLELHTIRAPFRGKVVKIDASIGETVHDGHPLLTLVSLDELKVDLYMPLLWYGRLETGRTYSLTAESPVEGTVTGTLQFVSPRIDSPTRTFRCVFLIDNNEPALPAGFDVQFDPQQQERESQ